MADRDVGKAKRAKEVEPAPGLDSESASLAPSKRANGLQPVAMDKEHFPATFAVLEKAVDRVAPGISLGVWLGDRKDDYLCSFHGKTSNTGEPNQPVGVETVYDLASLSKIFSTSTLAMKLIDEGKLHWDTKVGDVFPKGIISDPRLAEVTVEQLLTHSSGLNPQSKHLENMLETFAPGLGALMKERGNSLPAAGELDAERDYAAKLVAQLEAVPVGERQEKMRDFILGEELEREPGSESKYSDSNYILLGKILEEVAGLPLDRAAAKHVFEPLGLNGTQYVRTSEAFFDRSYAATETNWFRTQFDHAVQGQAHDPKAWTMGGYSGHAGVFAPLGDVMGYLRGMAEGDLISRETTEAALSEVPETGRTRGGWVAGENGVPFHTGFTGTYFELDQDQQIGIALLTNRVSFGYGHGMKASDPDHIKIKDLRADVKKALRSDLEWLGLV